ncbi:RagB/SusD family nutrient uptake outer membrane protein [Pedobacter sp. MC2016-24]|uniref:RagB/SusD family nutrient uptake outer membrane protein n=1 Tax=Pedobacter sp. MC2016-24 TaxID=2780090 RepID=UPI00187E0871|nr:RagB/SusD family nutrient uptake outer membrane protein [Pedobacter sp. MC2016-24]MBE9599272.1 RagB/SusD family nutrient uptake outer membrane protein [Pedobacter sp. MC2016-24]
MNLNKNIKYLLLATFALSATGCEKYLDTVPDMRSELNSVEKVAELLTSAYPKAEYISFTEPASDNAEDKGPGEGTEDPTNTDPYLWQEVKDRAQGSTDFYWNACYTAIAAANEALSYIDKNMQDPQIRPYKGEALLARAYAHFMLVTLYATAYDINGANDAPGVPYVTAPETVVFEKYNRGTVKSVYEQIQKDLEEGLPLIKNTAYKVQKYHFNIAAANAFATRFYLFKGDYNKVISHADNVFTGELVENSLRPWSTDYFALTPQDLRARFSQTGEKSNLLLIETVSWWARRGSQRYGFGQKLADEIFNRSNATGRVWGHKLYTFGGAPQYTLAKWKEHFSLTSVNSSSGIGYTILPAFTADEALLNRAEAYVSLGNHELALKDLNSFISTRILNYNPVSDALTIDKMKGFYRSTNDKEVLIKTILDFKKMEFITEGMRWFDILRHKLTVKHNILDINGKEKVIELAPGDPRRLFQLPKEVVLSGVAQNPR